ncbi:MULTISPECIES: translation initiation factor IF-2 [Sphingobacterium]|jgi:translation initiation factor IF-2|uniref:Translation initiation factor IF-2 n=2 Tax=Sphingobacterium TaxID=28453 RepID=A0ABX7CS37_SPHMU|nr:MULTISPECIES: translation initiation factor IF-2 [Sphingobacterium]QQT29068.1 translation initiation factor IF-2 [Sphingobacterium multivorum]QQT54902.1 translation initiation factor IF-2 [Sphingobacterium multivorum]QRY60122.1 translation initiation factor IF-2 [Sphingobacterium siyangense]RKF42260.1 translation initiation factor IF-2 [Sphingobacterium siyangense]
MTEGKGTNLLKAAKELNIGIHTAVECLVKKGYDVEAKPNTKLSGEMYGVLLKEFQGDKSLKDEAKQIVIGKIRREESPSTSPKESSKNEDFEDHDESKEILVKNTVEIPSVKETTPAKVEEPVHQGGMKVVGKIDLDALNRGGNKVKKEEPVKEEPKTVKETPVEVKAEAKVEEKKEAEVKAPIVEAKKEEPKVIEKKPEVVVPKAEIEKPEVNKTEVKATPVVETKTEPVKVEDKKKEETAPKAVPVTPIVEPVKKQGDEIISARAERLTGPKVIGKIELPSARPSHKPVASSSNAGNNNEKRKRKRTNPNGPVNPNAGQGQGHNNQHRGPRDGNNPNNRDQQGNRGGNHGPNNNPNNRQGQNNNQHPGRPGQGGNNQHPGRPGQGTRPQHGNRFDNRGKGRPVENKEEPTEKEIQDQIKATLARLSGAGKSGKFAQRAKLRRQKRDDVAQHAEEAAMEQEMMAKVLRVTEFVTANELANLMDVQVTQIIATCMSLGMFVSINQRLDAETLTIVADEFGYQVEFIKPEDEETAELEEPDNEANLVSRAPIVTVMGHVDHGKTSLLDYIRKANVTSGEAGGITQHIGAYAVKLEDDRKITFLDTPGHEAFTAMRARGAKVTDIVIIVIAADDAVMPQTKEAINHAQAAGVPIVFAFTKVDKPGANPDRIREQLSAMNILVEDWGGKFQAQEISAKTGENVDLLLEKVLLEAEMLDLKADPKKRAVGSVIEAALDKGRGIVTTVLIQSGTLRVGDPILAGSHSGKVKALTNERGERVKEAGPSVPVQILGMAGAPTAGDKLYVLESESEARTVANKRLQLQREQGMRATKHITLDEIGRRLAIGNFKELNIIVKGDVDGSIEALSDSLLKLSTDEIQVNIIHKSVGAISESDVLLASASDAIIIGFQVRPTQNARKLAENEQIDVRLYSIIYDAIDEIKSAMEGMLAPKFEEKIVAEVEIRETFKISKVGTIAGCMVKEGKINRNNDIRIIRDGVVIHTGKLASLKRFKDDVKEVSMGYECGLNIDRFNDIQVGDIVEAYEQVEVKRKL